MKFFKKLLTSLVSVDLHIRTTGHLLYQSLLIRIYGFPVTSLVCSLAQKYIRISCPGLVKTGSLIFFIDGEWYFAFLPELLHAVPMLHLFLMSFLILDQQNVLLSASIFIEPGCPKSSASTICFFSVLQGSRLCPIIG